MKKKHMVILNVQEGEEKEKVLETRRIFLPKWLVRRFFGIRCETMVIIPGESVKGIVIRREE